jgi:hypothetical protein
MTLKLQLITACIVAYALLATLWLCHAGVIAR